MYRITVLAFVTALALVAGVVADDDKKQDDKKKEAPKASVVKFELLKSGHMAVDVKVNGKGPYKLIFDTGAPVQRPRRWTRLAGSEGLWWMRDVRYFFGNALVGSPAHLARGSNHFGGEGAVGARGRAGAGNARSRGPAVQR